MPLKNGVEGIILVFVLVRPGMDFHNAKERHWTISF